MDARQHHQFCLAYVYSIMVAGLTRTFDTMALLLTLHCGSQLNLVAERGPRLTNHPVYGAAKGTLGVGLV